MEKFLQVYDLCATLYRIHQPSSINQMATKKALSASSLVVVSRAEHVARAIWLQSTKKLVLLPGEMKEWSLSLQVFYSKLAAIEGMGIAIWGVAEDRKKKCYTWVKDLVLRWIAAWRGWSGILSLWYSFVQKDLITMGNTQNWFVTGSSYLTICLSIMQFCFISL